MSLPTFDSLKTFNSVDICAMIFTRIRHERRRLNLSQTEFAEVCGVPLRTYKRFELGKCDSLDVLIRVIIEFERVAALELMFPPGKTEAKSRKPLAVLDRLLNKVQ